MSFSDEIEKTRLKRKGLDKEKGTAVVPFMDTGGFQSFVVVVSPEQAAANKIDIETEFNKIHGYYVTSVGIDGFVFYPPLLFLIEGNKLSILGGAVHFFMEGQTYYILVRGSK